MERLKRVAELKQRHSLGDNLCPDHRDKQAGKPCLACEVERLRKDLDRIKVDVAYWSYCTDYGMSQTCPEEKPALMQFLGGLGIYPYVNATQEGRDDA